MGSSEIVAASYVATLESYGDEVRSNISVAVMDANYLIVSTKDLRFDCEDSEDYRHLDLQGLHK